MRTTHIYEQCSKPKWVSREQAINLQVADTSTIEVSLSRLRNLWEFLAWTLGSKFPPVFVAKLLLWLNLPNISWGDQRLLYFDSNSKSAQFPSSKVPPLGGCNLTSGTDTECEPKPQGCPVPRFSRCPEKDLALKKMAGFISDLQAVCNYKLTGNWRSVFFLWTGHGHSENR